MRWTEEDYQAYRARTLGTSAPPPAQPPGRTAHPRPKPDAAPRHAGPSMNRTEAAYAAEVLARELAERRIDGYAYEAMTFRLGPALRYTPDFAAWGPGQTLALVEVKGAGPIRDDGLAKFKMAAGLYPQWSWTLVQRQPKSAGRGWRTLFQFTPAETDPCSPTSPPPSSSAPLSA